MSTPVPPPGVVMNRSLIATGLPLRGYQYMIRDPSGENSPPASSPACVVSFRTFPDATSMISTSVSKPSVLYGLGIRVKAMERPSLDHENQLSGTDCGRITSPGGKPFEPCVRRRAFVPSAPIVQRCHGWGADVAR